MIKTWQYYIYTSLKSVVRDIEWSEWAEDVWNVII